MSAKTYASLNYYLEITCDDGESPYRVQVMAENPDAAISKALYSIQRSDYTRAEIHEHRSDGTTAVSVRERTLVVGPQTTTPQKPNYTTFSVKLRRDAA